MAWTKENREQRTPMAFLGYQSSWAADESEVKVWEKSRRIGASWCEAGEDALLASRKNGMDVWYIGYNREMAQEFIEDAGDWARHYHKAASAIEEFVFVEEDRDIQAFRIRFASGWKIVALSSRPANLRGKQGKVVIDEAAFHDDLAGLLKAGLALLMWGGRLVILSTHNGDEHPYNELVTDIRAGKKSFALHRTTLDDALDQGLYQRICLRLGRTWSAAGQRAWRRALIENYGEDANEELFCVPARGSGVYLPGVLVTACMAADIPVLRWAQKNEFAEWPKKHREAETDYWLKDHLRPLLQALPLEQPCYFGEDFGRSGDLTVILPLQEQPGIMYRAPFCVELRNIPFEQQRQVLFYIVKNLPRFRGGALDARGNGEYLAEVAMQAFGSHRIHQVKLTQPWYLENMPPYKSAFEERTIVLPRDADILDDHRALRMERGIAKVPETHKGKGRDGGQRHGDAAIAGCLAWYAATKIEGIPAAAGGVDPEPARRTAGELAAPVVRGDRQGETAIGRIRNFGMRKIVRRLRARGA